MDDPKSSSRKPPRQSVERKPKPKPLTSSAALDRLDAELIGLVRRRWELLTARAHQEGPAKFAAASAPIGPTTQHQLDAIANDKLRRLSAHILRECDHGCHAVVSPLRIGYLGPAHSYSHLAALEKFGSLVEFCPLTTIAAVFADVHSRNLDFGVVPLENSTDGRVIDTLEMLARVPVRISAEVPLQIHHCLLGKGGRESIRKICSKPQALSQCRGWLTEHFPAVEWVELPSTAAAAEAAQNNSSLAAIASLQAATQYGLRILAENIEDNKQNVTRFAVIGEQSAARTGHDKTTVLFELPHEPGALADSLLIFKRHRTNLTWIESFPQPAAPQHYFFLVELVGHERDLRIRKCVAALQKRAPRVTILGSYPVGSKTPGTA